jgi:hypothetical protein
VRGRRCEGLTKDVGLAQEVFRLTGALLVATEPRERLEVAGARLEVVRKSGKVTGGAGEGGLGLRVASGDAESVTDPAVGGGKEPCPDTGGIERRIELLGCQDGVAEEGRRSCGVGARASASLSEERAGDGHRRLGLRELTDPPGPSVCIGQTQELGDELRGQATPEDLGRIEVSENRCSGGHAVPS